MSNHAFRNSGSGKGVIDTGVTQGALDSHGLEGPICVESASQTNHRIELEQGECDSRGIQVYLARFDRGNHRLRQGVHIYLQSDGSSGCRAYSRANASEASAFDGFMQLERSAPEVFVAKGVEAEDLATVRNQLLCFRVDRVVKRRGFRHTSFRLEHYGSDQ